ncbi:YgfZ/GcvT domain-containing protein [Mycetocola zhujimingii]|uniref:CAF17-like 4Fe-4S cluster assembly/insertion protein YgfZ n=1 Tax=Mycetocola zhujimingii TaxID=2079792 RepID=UPI000D3462DE|nr:glycine cleavage T C-terminal barrel domain-containing protein [Mycetocola zhujimingii]AWB87066.1 folate-binding protein YgfZ [Mycetocola zhujimingii]
MTASPFFGIAGAVEVPGAIDAGVPSHYGNPNIEQRRLAGGAAVVDLSNRGVISVTGPDRLTWLNSITSAELRFVQPGESSETLFLDPQGHIEYAAGVLDDGETTWLLVDPQAVEPLVAWLNRMKFMLRVEIADRTPEFARIGFLSDEVPATVPVASGSGIPLVWRDPWASVVAGGHQYANGQHPGADWNWKEALVARTALGDVASTHPAAGTLAAEALRVAAWRPRFATEVDEKTIPHELDWLRSAVHLAKGCYRGQETVAKVHNLGHPPRRLVMLHLDGSDSVLPTHGAPVRAERAGEQVDVGRITTAAIHHELGPIALAVIKRSVKPDAVLSVDEDGQLIAAAQQVIVPADAGAVADVPRLPRLGAVRRP